MANDEARWSFRRSDVMRGLAFFVAMCASIVIAVGLASLHSASNRQLPLTFTFVCLAGGSALGVVLSLVTLFADRRVEAGGDRHEATADG